MYMNQFLEASFHALDIIDSSKSKAQESVNNGLKFKQGNITDNETQFPKKNKPIKIKFNT